MQVVSCNSDGRLMTELRVWQVATASTTPVKRAARPRTEGRALASIS